MARPVNAFKELGRTGLKRQHGLLYEEFLRQLAGNKAVKVFQEMSLNDPLVAAVLFTIDMLIRKIEWRVEPGGDQPVDREAADFVESAKDDMSMSWEDTISEILTMLVYGFSFHETVYKRRDGGVLDPRMRSKHTDGRIAWRKLPIRSQDSVERWILDDEGGIKGMIQRPPPDFRQIEIPIEKALLFRTKIAKNSPEGESILRKSYRAWFIKKRLEEVEGIGIERDLAGLPMIYVPPRWLENAATDEEKAAREETIKIARDIKRDSQEGLVVPAMFDKSGNRLFEVTLLSTQGRRQVDASKVIARWDQRIAMTVLADFIMLGHEKVGSFALSSTKAEMFAAAIGAWTKSIAAVFNRHAIPRMFALNAFQVEELPELTPGSIETIDLSEVAEFVTAMAGAGMPLFPDPVLEEHLREAARLPQKSPEMEASQDALNMLPDAMASMASRSRTMSRLAAAGRRQGGDLSIDVDSGDGDGAGR